MSDLEINRFLQFQGLKIFYLESFCLSKVFIFFGVGREGANTLARFLQGAIKAGTGTLTGTIYNASSRLRHSAPQKTECGWRLAEATLHKLLALGNTQLNLVFRSLNCNFAAEKRR